MIGVGINRMKGLRIFLMGLLITIPLIIIFGLPIFLTAGTLDYWNGWLFLGIFATSSAFISILIPKLSEKRIKGMEKEKTQLAVKSLLTLCALAILIISGLNYRYQWSTMPSVIVIVSALIMTGAFILIFMVMKENRFASRVVEIQEDQKIIDTGIYSIVRHPMYLSFTIIFLMSPLVLGSLFSLIPALGIPFLLTFRIRGEEEVLRGGLVGYDKYMEKVKFRLIPFVW
jgi:protein-S-isoprenylcysteine O-methyltransferase Ste14